MRWNSIEIEQDLVEEDNKSDHCVLGTICWIHNFKILGQSYMLIELVIIELEFKIKIY